MAPVFESMGYAPPTATDVLDLVVKEEQEKVARINRVLHATQNGRHERKFLRDERGQAYGQVAAEIPSDLYFNLLKDRRFGPEALGCREGIAEVVKQFPSCGVKAVDLKFSARSQSARRNHAGINWRGSTMKFAT